MSYDDRVHDFSNGTSGRLFTNETNRIASSLDLLSYVADAQSPQPVANSRDTQDKTSRTKGEKDSVAE